MELAMKTVLLCAEMSDDFNFSVHGTETSHKSCFFEEWGLDKTAAVLYSDNNFIIKYNDREKVFPQCFRELPCGARQCGGKQTSLALE